MKKHICTHRILVGQVQKVADIFRRHILALFWPNEEGFPDQTLFDLRYSQGVLLNNARV